jgi:hypothetical protein
MMHNNTPQLLCLQKAFVLLYHLAVRMMLLLVILVLFFHFLPNNYNTKSYYASLVLFPWLAFLKPYLMLDVTDLAKKKSGAGGI